jgi:hypothetical protein
VDGSYWEDEVCEIAITSETWVEIFFGFRKPVHDCRSSN